MYELSNCGSNHYQGSKESNTYLSFERHIFFPSTTGNPLACQAEVPLHIYDIRISSSLQFLTNLHRTPTGLTDNLNLIFFQKPEVFRHPKTPSDDLHRTPLHARIRTQPSGCSHQSMESNQPPFFSGRFLERISTP